MDANGDCIDGRCMHDRCPIDAPWMLMDVWLIFDGCSPGVRLMLDGDSIGGRQFNLLPKCAAQSFWDVLWLGLKPFLVLYGFGPDLG